MEEWRAIEGHPGYEVSNEGRVRSVDRIDARGYRRRGMLRKPQKWRGRYLILRLPSPGGWKTRSIHQLVAAAFVGPRPTPAHEVNHRDGNKLNCRSSNLEWATRAENVAHAVRTGLAADTRGAKNGRAKLTEDDVREIRRLYAGGGTSLPRLARQFGVATSNVGMIVTRVTWKHLD